MAVAVTNLPNFTLGGRLFSSDGRSESPPFDRLAALPHISELENAY